MTLFHLSTYALNCGSTCFSTKYSIKYCFIVRFYVTIRNNVHINKSLMSHFRTIVFFQINKSWKEKLSRDRLFHFWNFQKYEIENHVSVYNIILFQVFSVITQVIFLYTLLSLWMNIWKNLQSKYFARRY